MKAQQKGDRGTVAAPTTPKKHAVKKARKPVSKDFDQDSTTFEEDDGSSAKKAKVNGGNEAVKVKDEADLADVKVEDGSPRDEVVEDA